MNMKYRCYTYYSHND